MARCLGFRRGVRAAAGVALLTAVASGCGSSDKTGAGPAPGLQGASAHGTTATSAILPTAAPASDTPASGTVTISFAASGLTTDALKRELAIVQQRITSQHLAATVTLRGTDIVVQGGSPDKDQLVMLGAAGVVQFRTVLAAAAAAGGAGAAPTAPAVPATPGSASSTSSTSSASSNPGPPPGIAADLWQTFLSTGCKNPASASAQASPAGSPIVACAQDGTQKYLLDTVAINGTDISAAAAAPQQLADGTSTGNWQVNLSFDAAGTRAFADVTTRLYQNGGQFAITMDGVVYSAPTVQSPITDGKAQISGTFTHATAQSLAAILQGGALPAPLRLDSVTG